MPPDGDAGSSVPGRGLSVRGTRRTASGIVTRMGGDARERVEHGGPGAAPKVDAHVAQIALESLAPEEIPDPQIRSLGVGRLRVYL